jgi:IclR family transcriptional regulator, pca regulon regulatory protein
MDKENSASASTEREQHGNDFVEALARGLGVLECFTTEASVRQRGRLTLSDAARLTGLTRGTTRRLLLTLKALRYVDSDGKLFWLTPKVLNFSEGFLAPRGLGKDASAIVHALTRRTGESASIGILDGADIVYLERVEVRRIYASPIDIGTRLPAHCSSIGRVLLAEMSHDQLENWLSIYGLQKLTPKTKAERGLFLHEIERVRRQGYALIDEELEIGIRSLAVPISGSSGRVVAALNTSASTAWTSVEEFREKALPELRAAAAELSRVMDW